MSAPARPASKRAHGPRTELWTTPVCKDGPPPLQRGEQMTVGQVRHPQLRKAFEAETQRWLLTTRRAAKKWSAKKLREPVATQAVQLVSAAAALSAKGARQLERRIGEALGWSGVTNAQLKELLESGATNDQVLQLLLANSTAKACRDARSDAAAAAAAKQQPRTAAHGGSDAESASDDDADDAAGAAAASDGDAGSDSEAPAGGDANALAAWQQQGAWRAKHAWLSLPTDIAVSGARVDTVPDTDERVPLRGQKGLWASEDLPEGHMLGPYRHYCLFSSTYNSLLAAPPPNWKGTASSWKHSLESYACTDDACSLLGPTGGDAADTFSLLFSGYGFGNATGYANDPHRDPIGELFKPGMQDDHLGPKIIGPDGERVDGNVQCLVVSICGWRYMFMATIRDVQEGQELAYEYGHGYWDFAARCINDCQKDELLKAMAEELAALRSKAAEAQAASSGLETASLGTAVAAPSAGGSVQPPSKAAAGGSVGVSDMRHALHGMQLRTGDAHTHSGSGGGASVGEMGAAGGDASAAGERGNREQQQEQPDDEQQQQASEAAAGAGGVRGSEEQDDASSAVPKALLAYVGQPLVLSGRQQQQLEARQQRRQQQQATALLRDHDGNERTVRRVNDPDTLELIEAAQMRLSEELLRYPAGIKFKKLSQAAWWKAYLQDYFCDRWHFIQRHSHLFSMSQDIFSPNTRIELTPEWREALEAKYRAEGLPLPGAAYASGGAAAGGQQQQQQVSANKRRRGVITRQVVLRDAALEAEVAQQRARLAAAEQQVQQEAAAKRQALAAIQLLLHHLRSRRVQLPEAVLQQLPSSGGSPPAAAAAAAAATAAAAPAPAAPPASTTATGAGQQHAGCKRDRSPEPRPAAAAGGVGCSPGGRPAKVAALEVPPPPPATAPAPAAAASHMMFAGGYEAGGDDSSSSQGGGDADSSDHRSDTPMQGSRQRQQQSRARDSAAEQEQEQFSPQLSPRWCEADAAANVQHGRGEHSTAAAWGEAAPAGKHADSRGWQPHSGADDARMRSASREADAYRPRDSCGSRGGSWQRADSDPHRSHHSQPTRASSHGEVAPAQQQQHSLAGLRAANGPQAFNMSRTTREPSAADGNSKQQAPGAAGSHSRFNMSRGTAVRPADSQQQKQQGSSRLPRFQPNPFDMQRRRSDGQQSRQRSVSSSAGGGGASSWGGFQS